MSEGRAAAVVFGFEVRGCVGRDKVAREVVLREDAALAGTDWEGKGLAGGGGGSSPNDVCSQ